MSTVHAEFAKLGKYKWVIYALVVIAQLSTVAYAAWRYHNIGVDGIPYQWRCVPRLETAAFGTDYIRIIFPEDTAKWLDNSMPETGKKIYVYISRNTQGMLQIEGASATRPPFGKDYMTAVITSICSGGKVQFQVPFGRYRMAPQMRDGIYRIGSTDSVIAQIRMKKGAGVIEGVFVNGIPLEQSSSGAVIAAKKAAQQPKTSPSSHGIDTGMVPPAEE